MMQSINADIIVAGGGMIGAAAACLLARQGLTIALVEQQQPNAFAARQPMDLRVSAISRGSVELLRRCGVWSSIAQMRMCAYQHLETWDKPENRLRFSAAEVGEDELGYIIENRIIQLALWQQLQQMPNVSIYCPLSITSVSQLGGFQRCELSNGHQLSARLILGCDGAASTIRSLAGIGITGWDYQQHCMLINIDTDFAQQNITWQAFTPTGPRAFLPLAGQHGSLVWYDHSDEIARLSTLSYAALKAEIVTRFPKLPGDFEVVNVGQFPLKRQHAQRYYQDGIILLGDAAHSINPLAGQGVNLGFKDVAALVNLIYTAIDNGDVWYSPSLQAAYQAQRRGDNLLMQSAMDLFYAGFCNRSRPLSLIRNMAIAAAQHSGPLKKWVLRYAMGLTTPTYN